MRISLSVSSIANGNIHINGAFLGLVISASSLMSQIVAFEAALIVAVFLCGSTSDVT